MEQFSLDKWLKDKSRKVTTRLGNREVRIICCDRKNNNNRPIITLMIDPDGNEYTTFHTKNGFIDEKEKYRDKRDLFFADEKPETIEVPFGAKDSEFIKDEYFIPEEPASEDWEEYYKKEFLPKEWFAKPGQRTISEFNSFTAKHFAEWQKRQMMENAVNATVYEGLFHKYIKEQDKNALLKALANFEEGDKVKIIIVKED